MPSTQHSILILVLASSLGSSACVSKEYNSEADIPRESTSSARSIEVVQEDSSALEEAASLPQCMSYAAKHSATLRASFEAWQAALERAPQVSALPNPQISWGYYLRSVETRAGPFRNRFSISQKIPWPWKLSLAAEVAHERARVAYHRFQEAEQKLFYQVKLAYYDLYYLRQNLEATKKTLDLVRYHETITRNRYRTAGGHHPAVIRAQLELGRLEDRIKSLQDLRTPMSATLNRTLNRPSNKTAPWPSQIDQKPLHLDFTTLLEQLRTNNKALRASSAEIDVHQKSIQVAKTEYLPDLTVGFDYFDTGSAIQSGTPNSSKDPMSLNFGLSIPIWTSKYAAGSREARAKKRAARARHVEHTRMLEAQLQRALFDFRDAERKINLYKDTLIPKAEQAQKSTVKSFKSGKGDFLNLIDIARTLLEFQLNYQKARADRARSLASIEALIGKELDKS